MNPIICIDFGSSYTKIARRRDWDSPARLLGYPSESLMPSEGEFLVPSVIARYKSVSRWMFGKVAAQLPRGKAVEHFAYWKSDLFETKADSARRELVISEVAPAFFRWLNQLVGDKVGVRTVICVPTFVSENPGLCNLLCDILGKAGFMLCPQDILTEPYSDYVGFVTGGKNKTTVHPDGRRWIDMLAVY